jgi:hypothetical protein
MRAVRLSAVHTGRLYPQGYNPGSHFYYGLSQPQGHISAGSMRPMKNPNDTIGNRTRDLPACIIVPLLSAPP